MKKMRKNKGFSLIEVLVALAMLSIIVATFLPLLSWLITRSKASAYDSQASLVLQEAMEVGYNVMAGRWDGEWTEYPEGIYHPAVDVGMSPEVWVLLPGPETGVEAKFDRQIEITHVCRDQSNGKKISGTCSQESGNRDNRSKVLTATVNWTEGGRQKSISAQLLVAYLGN